MSDEQDSWFKSAFGVDLGASLNKITAVVDQAKKTASQVVESVQGVPGRAGGEVTGAGAGSFPLGGSVGRGGKNAPNDVRAVQAALGIAADGRCGPQTIVAIKAYQGNLGHAKPDGRVDSGGATERALAGGAKAAVTPKQGDAQEGLTELDRESSSSPTGSTNHEERKDLVGTLLGHQAALLKSLQNAGSEAEKEQIQEELEGVGAEISDELQALKAKEPGRDTKSSNGPDATDGVGSASDTGSNATAGAGTLMFGVGQGLKDFAAETYAGMKENAQLVADGEHWVAGQIDAAQDIAAAKVQGVADLADGIPIVEQAADLGAAAFDQATQLTAGTWEGAVGLGGGLLQMVANPIDAARGLYTMAEHVPNPMGGPNPLKAAHGVVDVVSGETSLADTTAKLFDPGEQQKDDAEYWKKVGGGIADQYGKTVGEDGDYAKGVGRAIFDVGSNFFGVGEASTSAKAADAADAARAAEAAKLAEATRLAEAPALAERATLLDSILDDAVRQPETPTLLETLLDDAAKGSEPARVADTAKVAEASVVTKGGELLQSMLDDASRQFMEQELVQSLLDSAAKRSKAAELAETAKLAETPALTETAGLVERALDEAAKAVESSEVVQGLKTAVAKARGPKAGSVTAENINRVTGMQDVLRQMDELKLTLNDLGLTPDEVIRMANKDPAAAIAELYKKIEIKKAHAADVEMHAIAKQAKLDAWHAKADAERRWFREETVGRTPSKDSSVGRQVKDRMRQQGKLRGDPPNEEVFHEPTQEWYPVSECDMGHTTDAVRWWNKEGMYHGEKSEIVREWMNDPKNYELEPSRINRSRGAQVDEHYFSPHDDPITPDELAGRVKDRTPKPDDE